MKTANILVLIIMLQKPQKNLFEDGKKKGFIAKFIIILKEDLYIERMIETG